MKCQILFSRKNKKNITNLSSAESAHSLVSVNLDQDHLLWDWHSGSVVERPLCDREVAGSIPGRVIPKTLKMVLAAL